jgi:hypothetical protein
MKGKTRIWILAVVLLLILSLVACAPREAAEETDPGGSDSEGAGSISATTAWSPTSECSECHADEATSATDSMLLVSQHAAQKCVDCHSDTAALTTAHESAKPGVVSKATTKMATREFCLPCHGSAEQLAVRTESNTTLTDTNDTVVNPHAVSANVAHDAEKIDDCYNCHSMHKASPDAIKVCYGCHHHSVFECYTCHD